MIHPRRHVPINRAHLIPRLIFADLLKIHALAFEDAMVLAGESFAHQAIGANLDLADFSKNFARNHGKEGRRASGSTVPPGLRALSSRYPTLKRWAIVSHPFGMMLILSGLQPCRAQNLRDHPE